MREIVDEYKVSLSKRIKAGIKDFEFHDEFNKVKKYLFVDFKPKFSK